MFIVKTAPSPNEETLVRTAPLLDGSDGPAVRDARRVRRARRGARPAVLEHRSAPWPAVGRLSPSEDGVGGEWEAA
jgi:hypothetical protein